MIKATNEEIISAYRETGSVWRAAKRLGMAGQTVHERLRAFGYPMASRNWTEDEVEELRALVGHMTVGEIASRLGRPYTGVAGKISSLGIGTRFGNRRPIKLPRGAGYDKASAAKYTKAIDKSGMTVHKFARANGLGVENLCGCLERYETEWWEAYRRAHSDLPEKACGYCGRRFVPSNAKQEYCTRKCGSDHRVDSSYFGGNRREAIGWTEGVCQVCGRTPERGLTPHHVFGKENDPENLSLIAVCQGCHKLITALGGRDFNREQWEALISLVWLRRHGDDPGQDALWVSVDIWREPAEEEERPLPLTDITRV